ncbi:hypothetical protein DVH05_015796 [Phytophthora capsici]|nr:hypothetical protein DVH05_015796 [Phytophthora capsici]
MYLWFLKNPMSIRHLFAYLPYPELEAKRWPLEHLVTWGKAEEFNEQTAALARPMDDSHQPEEATALCREWYVACMRSGLEPGVAGNLARDPNRWNRLLQWVPETCARQKPQELHDSEWCILHILPYTIAGWKHSPMGRAPNSSRALWHQRFAVIKQLCDNIGKDDDWSLALAISVKSAAQGGVGGSIPTAPSQRN